MQYTGERCVHDTIIWHHCFGPSSLLVPDGQYFLAGLALDFTYPSVDSEVDMPHLDALRTGGLGGSTRRRRSAASSRTFGIAAPSVAPGGQPTVPVASTGPIQPRLLPPTAIDNQALFNERTKRLKRERKNLQKRLTGLSGLSARGDVTGAQFKEAVRRQRNALAANPLG